MADKEQGWYFLFSYIELQMSSVFKKEFFNPKSQRSEQTLSRIAHETDWLDQTLSGKARNTKLGRAAHLTSKWQICEDAVKESNSVLVKKK